jgi:hypothetical protein
LPSIDEELAGPPSTRSNKIKKNRATFLTDFVPNDSYNDNAYNSSLRTSAYGKKPAPINLFGKIKAKKQRSLSYKVIKEFSLTDKEIK